MNRRCFDFSRQKEKKMPFDQFLSNVQQDFNYHDDTFIVSFLEERDDGRFSMSHCLLTSSFCSTVDTLSLK